MGFGKKDAEAYIEKNSKIVTDVSDKIWELAEISLQENESAALYVKVLKELGFEVKENINGIKNAFSASCGAGRPRIGILAEYDALSGLSQKAGSTVCEPLTEGGNGHGCGHNMLGAGALAAAIGIKEYLENNEIQGEVILYGCPGEEAAASKAFLARDKEWERLDAALTWHPDDTNEVVIGSSNACVQNLYSFKGTAAHASGNPEMGRSALDAVELMNIGVQFLREHMTDDARVHYAITNSGGISPNVVQAKAEVLYFVRSKHISETLALQERVDKIAEGAALMTGTAFEKKFIDGLSDTVANHELEKLLYKNFEETGVSSYTKEEHEFADALYSTYDSAGYVPGLASTVDSAYAGKVLEIRERSGHAMNDFLLPLSNKDVFMAGSTDVGDVSWQCPTGQIHVAAWPNGTPGHSWQNVSCGKTSIGHKAVITAGKVLCGAAIDLLEQPELIKKARAEFEYRTKEGYICPIPADAKC